MPSSGRLGAVSDYEHLNSQSMLRNSKHLFPADDSQDSDFLPLKPSKSINKDASVQLAGKTQQAKDFNSNNASSGLGRASNKIGLTQMLDDFGQIQMANMVPVPTAWSPGMVHAPNPDLFITPEKKTAQTSKVTVLGGKENLSELQTSSNVPVPFAWSPGMVLRPNPDLMVTPDKPTEKKSAFTQIGVAHGRVTEEVETLVSRYKEKPTVRFDLPSASSGDETLETSQEFFTTVSSNSPITLKGRELEDDGETTSPPWKAFSPQKAYNPNVYSDESTLEDSIQGASDSKHPGQGTNTAQIPHDTQDLTSDRLADKLQELLMSSASETHPLALSSSIPSSQHFVSTSYQSKIESQNLSASSKSRPASSPSRKVLSAASIPRHPKPAGVSKINQKTTKSTSGVNQKPVPNAGPEFLKIPPSAYEPKPSQSPQPRVLREWDSSPERNNYSFPFDVEGTSDVNPGSEHTFARPEYNSTLRVRSELDELCEREIDVEKAVAVALTKSENKRTELSEKASMFTNRMSDQFGNLVDLNPSVESLCSRAVRMRTSKVRSKKPTPAAVKPAKSSSHAPPDLMEFLPSDLQKESPDFSLPGIKTMSSALGTAPQDVAFDLYRHNRVWHGITDY